MPSKVLIVGVLAALIGLSLATGANVQSEEAFSVSLRLAGSTVPSMLLAKWNTDFGVATGGVVNAYYGVQQTGVAKALFISNAVDFVLVDVPLTGDEKGEVEVARGSSIAHAPVAATGIAITYHAASLGLTAATPLKLNSTILAAIYSGHITRWNDAAIVALNPTLHSAALNIKPIVFDGQAGTTYILTRYLVKESVWAGSPSFSIDGGANSIHVTSPSSIVQTVIGTPGAIAYVAYGDALTYSLPSAALDNEDLVFVQPSLASFAAAATSFETSGNLPGGTDVWGDDLLLDVRSSSGNAYPISFYVYAIFNIDQAPAGTSGAAIGAWAQWVQLSGAQSKAADYGFSSLSNTMVTVNNNTLATMTYATGTSPTDYWPYIAPSTVMPTTPPPVTPPTSTNIKSNALQVIIILVLVALIILVVGIDQWRGGCIIKCHSTGRGIWA